MHCHRRLRQKIEIEIPRGRRRRLHRPQSWNSGGLVGGGEDRRRRESTDREFFKQFITFFLLFGGFCGAVFDGVSQHEFPVLVTTMGQFSISASLDHHFSIIVSLYCYVHIDRCRGGNFCSII